MTERLLITGTDTGVGKTRVGALLAAARVRQGRRVAWFKPVETGVAVESDAASVRAIAGPQVIACTGTLLPEPLSPTVAAARAGARLDPAAWDSKLHDLERSADTVIIEGAGGLLVEAAPGLTFADLAVRWRSALLVVVANRLGCINHLALTLSAAQLRGVGVLGWVLNHAEVPTSLAAETNPAELARRFGPAWAVVDFGADCAAFPPARDRRGMHLANPSK